MKMKLKNNWNDKILLESSYRKSKFNTHHFKQIIITWLQKLKKKSHFFIGKNAITINKKYHTSSYKYEATVYKIQKAVKILQYNFWKTPFDICRLEWCTTQNVCFVHLCSFNFFSFFIYLKKNHHRSLEEIVVQKIWVDIRRAGYLKGSSLPQWG